MSKKTNLKKVQRKKVKAELTIPGNAGRTKNLRTGSTRPSKIVQLERDRRALEARKSGATYEQIAGLMGWSSPASAYRAVKRMMGRIVVEAVPELRIVQYERLNHMLMVLWAKVNAGDERSMQTAMGIMDQMNKLMGVEAAPPQQEVKHSGGVLVIQSNVDDYLHGLQRMAGVLDASQINEPKELTEGTPRTAAGSGVIDLPSTDVLEVIPSTPTALPRKKKTRPSKNNTNGATSNGNGQG